MPTIVDSLVVLLGLDASKFTQGQAQAQTALKKTGDEAEKQRKAHEESAKKTAQAYDSVRESILGVAAAIVTAVAGGEFLNYLTKNDAAAGRLATNIGATTREVSILEGVWRRMGSSASDADGFLRSTNKILEEIKLTGTSQALTPFAQAGLNIGAFRDAKNYQDRVKMLAAAASRMNPQDAQFRLQAAGYSEDTIGVILRNAGAFDELFRSQERLNVVNDRDSQLAAQRVKAWSEFDQSLEKMGRTIYTEVSPALTLVYDKLTTFVQGISTDAPTAISVVGILSGATLALAGSMGIAGTAASALLLKLGPFVAIAASLYEVIHLLDAGSQLLGIKTRQGVTLTPEAQARLNGGALNGLADPFHSGGSGAGAYADVEKKWGLPAGLLSGIKGAETGGGSGVGARSGKGAMGPFQFIPSTAAAYGLKNPDDPTASADAAGHYLHDLLGMYGGDVNKAIAAYNEGPGNLNKGYMPLETQKYLATVNQGMQGAQSRAGGGSNVTIQNMEIKTSSNTLTGIGADVGKGLQNYNLAQQSNTGMQ